MQGGVDDSIRRHPSSLAPPERHRRFGPWGILAAGVSAGALVAGGLLAVSIATSSGRGEAGQVMGRPAPEFRLRTVDGRTTISLSGLRGRVVVLSFGRSGCGQCRSAEAALDRAWRHFRQEGVVVMGVRTMASVTASLPPPDTLHRWPELADPGGRTASAFGVHTVPETFVISADGRVVAGLAGSLSYPALVAQISMLLGVPATRMPTVRPTPS
ncbi:MAG: TlpA family protein disulfide reductase [Actinomycetota bacterium]